MESNQINEQANHEMYMINHETLRLIRDELVNAKDHTLHALGVDSQTSLLIAELTDDEISTISRVGVLQVLFRPCNSDFWERELDCILEYIDSGKEFPCTQSMHKPVTVSNEALQSLTLRIFLLIRDIAHDDPSIATHRFGLNKESIAKFLTLPYDVLMKVTTVDRMLFSLRITNQRYWKDFTSAIKNGDLKEINAMKMASYPV